MNFTIERAAFLTAAKHAAQLAPSASPLEVLKCALLEIDTRTRCLHMTATNMEVTLRQDVPLLAYEGGDTTFAIDAKLLSAMVLGHLDHFYPEIAARICCGGSFVDIDPGTVVEGLEEPFPPEWCTEVRHGKAPVSKISPRKAEKTGIWGWKALDLLLGDLK